MTLHDSSCWVYSLQLNLTLNLGSALIKVLTNGERERERKTIYPSPVQ